MVRARTRKSKMTIEVHGKDGVHEWEQRLVGIPRKGERLSWTCHREEGSYTVVAEVQHLLWDVDGAHSENLQPVVVCKEISVSPVEHEEPSRDRSPDDYDGECYWDGDWEDEDEWDDDDWDC